MKKVGVETLEGLNRCERLKICKEFICPITKIIIYVNEYGEIFDIYKRLVKQYKDADGYCYVGLRKNLKRKNYKVHRLVAILFIDNPENKPDVNHKDGIKHNNVKTNLEWNTKSEKVIVIALPFCGIGIYIGKIKQPNKLGTKC